MLERNIWMYISSVQYIYEKLIEPKRIKLKRNHKRKRKKYTFSTGWQHQLRLNVSASGQSLEPHLVSFDITNQD